MLKYVLLFRNGKRIISSKLSRRKNKNFGWMLAYWTIERRGNNFYWCANFSDQTVTNKMRYERKKLTAKALAKQLNTKVIHLPEKRIIDTQQVKDQLLNCIFIKMYKEDLR